MITVLYHANVFLAHVMLITVIIAGKRDELWFVGPPKKVHVMETEYPNPHVSSLWRWGLWDILSIR